MPSQRRKGLCKRPSHPTCCLWACPGAASAWLLQLGALSCPLSHLGPTELREVKCVTGRGTPWGRHFPVNFPAASTELGAKDSRSGGRSSSFLHCKPSLWDRFACFTMKSVINWEQLCLLKRAKHFNQAGWCLYRIMDHPGNASGQIYHC